MSVQHFSASSPFFSVLPLLNCRMDEPNLIECKRKRERERDKEDEEILFRLRRTMIRNIQRTDACF